MQIKSLKSLLKIFIKIIQNTVCKAQQCSELFVIQF